MARDPGPAARAAWFLSVVEPEAAAALRDALGHPIAEVRAAAVRSLANGWSAEDLPSALAALADPAPAVRREARAALAELGGPRAADAIARGLSEAPEDELLEPVEALAWLRDPRALGIARRLAHERLGRLDFTAFRGAQWALVRLGDRRDRRALVDAMLELAIDRSTSPSSHFAADEACRQVIEALRSEHPDEADAASDELHEREPEPAPGFIGRSRPPPALREPLAARTVPRMTFAELLRDPPPRAAGPAAKMGGQPDWLGEPAWPLAGEPATAGLLRPASGPGRADGVSLRQPRRSRCDVRAAGRGQRARGATGRARAPGDRATPRRPAPVRARRIVRRVRHALPDAPVRAISSPL